MTKALVHGNPETEAIWWPLAEALRARGVDDLVLLSPPGFGAPTPPGWEPTAASYVGWLEDELERLGGPVDLVGHDWGAGHTFGLAAQRPDLLRSWAADCSGLLHPEYQWHDAAQLWQRPGAGEEFIAGWVDQPLEDRLAQFEQGFGMPPDVADSLARALDPEMGRCILELYRSAAQPAMAELGERLAAAERRPALIIAPLEDPYVPASLATPVAERLGASLLPLEGRGHWWMLEPGLDDVADSLVEFWAGPS